MKTIITLSNLHARLPDHNEIRFFNEDNSSFISDALKMILTSELTITEEVVRLLKILETNHEIFLYALQANIFEDGVQTRQLLDLIKTVESVFAITHADIDHLNLLNDIEHQILDRDLEEDLLNKAETRHALRILKRHGKINHEEEEPLIEFLLPKQTHLLTQDTTRELLLRLKSTNNLTKKNISLLSKINKHNLTVDMKNSLVYRPERLRKKNHPKKMNKPTKVFAGLFAPINSTNEESYPITKFNGISTP